MRIDREGREDSFRFVILRASGLLCWALLSMGLGTFADGDIMKSDESVTYEKPREIIMKNITTESGMPLKLSSNPVMFSGVKLIRPEEYQLVWADEFEKNGPPDPKKWTFEKGFVRNRELQWYQPENAICKDGRLVIEARREQKPNPGFVKGSDNWKQNREVAEYTSACLMTKGLHSWQYGRFEIKARIQAKPGLWPAIWFLGVEGQWPSNGEIDLMEFYRGKILANACWGTEKEWEAKWDSASIPLEEFGDPQWDQKFHIWRMDWDPDHIRLYVDDRLLNTIDLTETINPNTDLGPKNPFHQPHYLLLNLAIGGNNGGDPSETEFPSRYEIEYVRVYQKKSAGTEE
jgi:beta-glucanase (GH16 family)